MPPQTRKGALVWKVKDKDEPKAAAEPEETPQPAAPKQKTKPEKQAPEAHEAGEEQKKSGGKAKGKGKKVRAAQEQAPEVAERVERPKEGRRKGNDGFESNKGSSFKSSGKGHAEAKEPSGKSAKGKGKGKESGSGGGGKGKGRASGPSRASADDDDLVRKPSRNRDDSHKQHIEATGESCSVKKHSSMGIAVVSFNSQADRDTVLSYAERERQNKQRVRSNGKEWGPEVDIGGLKVEVKRHTDKNTNQEIPTDIFAAWGHQGEKETPLEADTIAEAFDLFLAKATEATETARAAAAAIAKNQSAPFTSTKPFVQQPYAQSPPPPPGHYPSVGGQQPTQGMPYGQQAVAYGQQAGATPQASAAQPAFPDAYGYWLAQQQFAQQQQWMAHQQYQQQQLAAAQAQAQQQQQMASELYKPLPKPLKIVDPKEGTAIETLGLHFKPREESKPLKIINPASGESIPGLPS